MTILENPVNSIKYLAPTALLDFNHPEIAQLIIDRGWQNLPTAESRIGAAYMFVRDEIRFGYNRSDDLSASTVLVDGLGQCNTKATLLMALLRSLGIECRLHGATIHKNLQRGAVAGIWYALAPKEIIHTWAEVRLGEQWVGLEGVILDLPYIAAVRKHVKAVAGPFTGYGIATKNIAKPNIEWRGETTQIQAEGIARDFGIYDNPDDFYAEHGVNMSFLKRAMFRLIVRHLLNHRVSRLRGSEQAY
jgi:hypothetical protein